ncbi:MAG: response regulator transcription factor [Acidobacteriota bacterium]|nr:response regulator transcription factor [Blastocatellia bacterium]MDW8238988.1 response regulator transcription factor [Acidobacteriota bacterium]
MKRVLIIEDDPTMAVALRDGFRFEGYDVLEASDGVLGLQLAAEQQPDLIILDIMLPQLSGLDVCQRLRSQGYGMPIIMLTARGQEMDKVRGLRLGADDYVTKPFSFVELMARVEAVLRRASKPAEKIEIYRFGNITLDFKRVRATKGEEALELSPREFDIMRYFIEHRGEVVTRDQLLDAVWGYQNFPFTRTVDMHIAKLRKKIEDTPSDPRYIITVHRIGYKFVG